MPATQLNYPRKNNPQITLITPIQKIKTSLCSSIACLPVFVAEICVICVICGYSFTNHDSPSTIDESWIRLLSNS